MKKFRRRATIEPLIGHLKKNFRMQQNYLTDEKAPKINAMPAATGWNLKKLMEILVEGHLYCFFKWVEYILKIQCPKLKWTL